MGGLLGGSKKSTSTSSIDQTQTPVLPDYLKDLFPDLANRANSLSLSPYTPYTGQGVAGLTPEQLQAFQGVKDMQGQQNPLQVQAQSLLNSGSQNLTSSDISQYMSPYMQNVVDQTKRGALRDFDIQMNSIGDAAANAGAFGGDRHGVVEANAYNDLNTRLSDIQTQGLQTAYGDAQNLALSQQQNQLNSGTLMSQLAGANQAQDLTGLAALEQTGATQQNQAQQGLNWDYGQFAKQQQYPYDQVNFLSSILYPMAQLTTSQHTQGTTTNTQTQPGSSPLSSMLGLGSMLAAPFTGGASLGLGGLGSLGGMLGSGMAGLSSMMGGTGFGTGSSVYNLVNGPLRGSIFKEGGQVKGYASGGSVSHDRDILNPLYEALTGIIKSNRRAAYSPSEDDSPLTKAAGYGKNGFLGLGSLGAAVGTLPLEALRAPTTDLQLLGDWLTSPSKPKEEDTVNLGDKNKNEAMYQLQQAAAYDASEGKVGRKSSPEFAKFFADNMSPDDLDPEMNKNVLAIAEMMDKHRIKESPEETPSESPEGSYLNPDGSQMNDEQMARFTQQMAQPNTTKEESPGWNLPLLAFGARMLASPGEGFGEALGNSVMQGMTTKMQIDKIKSEAQQQALENQLAQDRAESYKLQTEISRDNQKMNQELFPLKKQEIQAEVAYKQAQASEKGDPLSSAAAKILQKKIEQRAGMTISKEDLDRMQKESLVEAQAIVGTKSQDAGLANVTPSTPGGFKFIGTEE